MRGSIKRTVQQSFLVFVLFQYLVNFCLSSLPLDHRHMEVEDYLEDGSEGAFDEDVSIFSDIDESLNSSKSDKDSSISDKNFQFCGVHTNNGCVGDLKRRLKREWVFRGQPRRFQEIRSYLRELSKGTNLHNNVYGAALRSRRVSIIIREF